MYPNPVTNGILNLQLTNESERIYEIRLLNKMGQAVISKQINHTGGDSIEPVALDKYFGHGIYQVEVSKPDGSKTNINVAVMK